MERRSIADFLGPWSEPNFDSGLVDRCRQNWNVPISELSDEALATFLRQKIALQILVPEAKRRIETGASDGTEIYEGELREAILTRRLD